MRHYYVVADSAPHGRAAYVPRGRSQRRAACRIDDHTHHRTMVLDDPVDAGVPRVRPGARVDNDVRDGRLRISKSWKDQSRRRHQYRTLTIY